MPRSDITPQTLDAWLSLLDQVRLPIVRSEQLALQQALMSDHLSLRELASRVQSSPTFVLALIREASQGRSEPIGTTEMALRRLGLGRALALLQSLDAEEQINPALAQLQLVSLHALQQAEGIFGPRLARLAGEIQLASLLFLAPLWSLAQAHPELFEQWVRRVVQQREPASRVERRLLGIDLRNLCLALAEHWCLPEWIALGYRLLGRDRRSLVKALHIAHDDRDPLHQQQMLDEEPTLRRWLTQPSNTILLANGIAIAAHSDWNDVHSLRWQRLTALYLNLPVDAVQVQVHQRAAISARLHARPGLWHPAQMLVWSGPREKPKPLPVCTDPAAWQEHCARLRQPASFANAVQLLDCAREALIACGVPRLLLLVANREHSQLLAQQSHGLTPPPSQTRISTLNNELLRRMLQKPSRLKLDAETYRRFANYLPAALTAHFDGPPVLLQSLASGGRVRLLLVAEWPARAKDAPEDAYFNQTLGDIEHALAQLGAQGAGNA